MADVTLSYKGSDILELSDSGSATLKTGGKYCEGDIDVEYAKPSGGGNTLTSDFLTIYKETVTIGENTISNSAKYKTYLDSIKSIPGSIVAMSIHKKTNYVYNEFANGLNIPVGAINGYRYRNGWGTAQWNNSSYDAVVPIGTLVDIYTVELKNPVNV